MDNEFISKIKRSKPFSIMVGITAVLTAIITFTDTVEKVSNKINAWRNPETPKTEVVTTAITNESQSPTITIIAANDANNKDNETSLSTTTQQIDGSPDGGLVEIINTENILDAFTAYNSKHVTHITDFSDAIAINKNNLIMDLSVSSFIKDTLRKPMNDYHINKRGVFYEINPSYDYLKDLSNGSISQSDLTMYNFGQPRFDIKTVNNSDKSVFITKAIFKIKKSVPDIAPYIRKRSGNGFDIPLQNIGYGPALNANLQLKIKDSTGIEKIHEMRIDSLVNYCKNCDVTEILKMYHVDTDFFKGGFSTFPTQEAQEKARGAFKTSYISVDGVITYDALNNNKTLQSYAYKFSHEISLQVRPDTAAMLSSMALASAAYDLKLDLDKTNYTKTINVSQVLAPHGFDRFQVNIYADKSSRHLMDLVIVYNDGQTLTYENIALNYFKPSSMY